MPFLPTIQLEKNCKIGIWKISESFELLREYCGNNKIDISEVNNIKNIQKKKEYLASRLAFYFTCKEFNMLPIGINKDEHGKPYLIDNQGNISISHSREYACCVIDQNHNIGFDIEFIQPKIINILPKILSEKELENFSGEIEEGTKYWSIKEAAYKLNGKKGVSFSEGIFINNDFRGGTIQDIHFETVYLETIDHHIFCLIREKNK